ncbi:carbohydrate porin [Acinetobacter sp. C_4_1]|uniref:carbohydrate porin n=1 Tax=unclassified Acinetobacter TaxID=196816 RepID=UPI0021B762F7|nr:MULTISPECIES: carbohydrate porin [unclassified Acinetobacter]MCT8090381.1 carbohydrate porin [Acinetobacter sp. F_3_1]MCT8098786.1 carbohydrate porin [Acinetobacter sp. C_3_1]MCT8102005.1 carbohydrate porin [Acinetobacter sp. C_4_1]MCT8135752.1 carbohydrate porin [Acinetobacter sp. T_3_1]
MKKLCRAFSFSISLLSFSCALQIANAADAFDPQSQWMFGDWNGKRTELQAKGYDFSLGYTGELATLMHSENHSSHGTEYADQFAFGAHLDLNKILGWPDTEAQITVTERNGRNLSNTSEALNGHKSSVQEVWGRGQTWRLTDFWIKKKFLDQKLDVKVGRFGEGEDFNSFDCDFQNLSLCGSQVGNWVGDQWYNWPVSQWAARLKYSLTPEVYAQVGAYEYNPENLERGKGFNLSTDGSHGAIIPAEVVWTAKLGVAKLPGEYRAGYYYSTADAALIASTTTEKKHHQGGWVVARQQLTAHNGDASRGLSGFVNLTVHDSDTNQVSDMQNIGLVYKGLIDSRPHDEIAVGIARININDKVNDANIRNNSVDARGLQGEEYNSEIYYGMHAANWLTIRPNIQYIHRVGAYKNGENAWVGGIKFQTAF